MRSASAALIVAFAVFLAACTATETGRPPVARGTGGNGYAGAEAELPTPATGLPAKDPGQPPIVWIGGRLETITPERLAVVEESGAPIVLGRLAEGATSFFSERGGTWRAFPSRDALRLEPGTPVCVEALLDEGTYLALRVFAGGSCGPAGAAGGD